MSRRGSHHSRQGDVRDRSALKGATPGAVHEIVNDALLSVAVDLSARIGLHKSDVPFVLLAAVELPDGAFQCRHVVRPAEPPPRALIEFARGQLGDGADVAEGAPQDG